MDKKILLADDEATFRETFAKVLQEEGMAVTAVSNGTDAIDAAINEYDETITQGGHLGNRQIEPEKYPEFRGEYSWSEHSARRMASTNPDVARPGMLEYLRKRGLLLE